MNRLELFNAISGVVKIDPSSIEPAVSEDITLEEAGLDSLDLALFNMYMSELYGIPKDSGWNITITTIRAMFDYAEEYGEAQPTSVTAALEAIQ